MTDVQLGITLVLFLITSLVGYGLGFRNGQISGELAGLKQRLAKKRNAQTRQTGGLSSANQQLLASEK